MQTTDTAHTEADLDARRKGARRTALVLGAIAIAFYIGFIVVNLK